MDLGTRSRASREVLRKARGILREYVLDLYFPAQRLSRWQRARRAPLLFLVEYLVYRVDAVAEDTKDVDLDTGGNKEYDKLVRYKRKFEALLRGVHAHNEVVARQLDMGEQYVRLENKVTAHGTASHEQVLRLAELRSSDVRLLHGMTLPTTPSSGCTDRPRRTSSAPRSPATSSCSTSSWRSSPPTGGPSSPRCACAATVPGPTASPNPACPTTAHPVRPEGAP
jgi:hypothetical protein